jgi:hypothetical protein
MCVYPLKLEKRYTIQGHTYVLFATIDLRLGKVLHMLS